MGGIISIPDTNSGNEWGKYKPWGTMITKSDFVQANQYLTVLEITGEGYLALACHWIPLANGRMKVTIDGVIVYEALTNTAIEGGIFLADLIGIGYGPALKSYNKVTGHEVDLAMLTNYPISGYSGNYPLMITRPIFFTKSLKVEGAIVDGSTNITYTFMGGVV